LERLSFHGTLTKKQFSRTLINLFQTKQSEENALLEQEEDAELAEIERLLKEQGVTFESSKTATSSKK